MKAIFMVSAMIIMSTAGYPIYGDTGFCGWGMVAWKLFALVIAYINVRVAMEA